MISFEYVCMYVEIIDSVFVATRHQVLTVAADLIVEAVTEPVRFLRYAHREWTTFTYPMSPLLTTFTNYYSIVSGGYGCGCI